MTKYRAIPQGFMTIGEVAKKMGVTVRTLQYYDKEGLLSPSGESEGGRRLYTDKDLIILHQIISLKSLGFTLEDIKGRLMSLNTPKEVAEALADQEEAIQRKIEQLSSSLEYTRQLRTEVLQMQSVDFKKYADIIINLQMKNEYYGLVKHFEDDTLKEIRKRFDKESSLVFIKKLNDLFTEIINLQKKKVPPESDKSQQIAKEYWELLMEFTDGDLSMFPQLMKVADAASTTSEEQEEKLKIVKEYIEPALEIYFSRLGVNPFQEEET